MSMNPLQYLKLLIININEYLNFFVRNECTNSLDVFDIKGAVSSGMEEEDAWRMVEKQGRIRR